MQKILQESHIRQAIEKGIFEGYEIGTRVEGKTYDGTAKPLKITGRYLQEIKLDHPIIKRAGDKLNLIETEEARVSEATGDISYKKIYQG